MSWARAGRRVRTRPRGARLAWHVFGRRAPHVGGVLAVEGSRGEVVIRRDRWGIPHVDAGDDPDAWFGLGFCQGQDRSFQLEVQLRAARGTLAELLGADAVPVDRLSRRLGLHQAAAAQLAASDLAARRAVAAFARGLNAGRSAGSRGRPHELVLLRRRPTPFTDLDVAAVGPLVSFLLSANWDLQLARLRVLVEDGEQALVDVEPPARRGLGGADDDLGGTAAPPAGAGRAGPDTLAAELAAVRALLGRTPASGSNAWAVDGWRARSGRPLLACDPHLAPSVPALWYLAHLVTPNWQVAGASLVGGPAFPVGFNGHGAFGLTNAYSDTSELVLEELDGDGRRVRRPSGWVACDVRREVITVRGGAPVVEEVLVTPAGPLVEPLFEGERHALALRASWLAPGPVRAPVESARDWSAFRRAHEGWPCAGLNVVWAGAADGVGWQLVGRHPRRPGPSPRLPVTGPGGDGPWQVPPLGLDELPHRHRPASGYEVSANQAPTTPGRAPGADWADDWRADRLAAALASRADWDVDSTAALQLDRWSPAWAAARPAVLALPATGAGAVVLDVLRPWDGIVAAGSTPAGAWQLFLAELAARLLAARAPRSWRWAAEGAPHALGGAGFARRRISWLVGLLVGAGAGAEDQGSGGNDGSDGGVSGSDEGRADVRAAAVAALDAAGRRLAGAPDPAWGALRPLTLRHVLSRRPLDRLLDLGPLPLGGDGTTVAQAMPPVLDPTKAPLVVPSLRMVVEVGAWGRNRVALAGGQSGNPALPHYDDLLGRWHRGEGITIAWSPSEVAASTRHTLILRPAGAAAPTGAPPVRAGG